MYNENRIRRCSCADKSRFIYRRCRGNLALIVGIITHFVTVSNLRKNAESKIGNAEAKAREIIDDAVKTAETTKKESLLK